MGEFDLNLSTRPFPAYQLKTLLLAAAAIVLLALSVWQVYGFTHYSARAAAIRGEASSGEVSSLALSRRLADMDSRLNRPEAISKLDEIGFFNAIIARKTLSWTRLFSTLEALTPDNVHLVGLRPEFIAGGVVLLHFEVTVRSVPDLKSFLVALQSSPLFSDVIVTHEEKKQAAGETAAAPLSFEEDVSFNAKYYPDREGQ